MKTTKKFLSVFLALLMIVSIIPMASITASAADISGACGENLTWTFDESTGTLTISGTGEMEDYNKDNRPWESYEDVIATVIISNGVTRVGNNSFFSCNYLKNVTFAETITSIGDSSFCECVSLTSIIIPDSVTDIGAYAFDSCTSLNNVKLSNSILTLGGRAFGYTAIKTIEIPKSLESCTEVLRNGVWEWSYEMDGTEYWLKGGPFYCCEELEIVTFETGTTQVASLLFRGCTGLKKIEIPDTVTSINSGAFAECLRLSTVEIGNAVSKINNDAFLECVSLTSVIIPDSVTEIGTCAFDSCTSLKNVTLSNSLLTLGGRAFGYTAIETIDIPKSLENCQVALRNGVWEWSYEMDGTEYWLKGGPFYCCEKLKTATFETGTSQIVSSLFRGCTGLKKIQIPDTVTSINEGAFAECFRLTDVTIGNAVKKINSDAFLECISLEEITIPDSVTEIGYTVFRDCNSLESIELPDTITNMGHGVFLNCESLTDVDFSENVEIIPKDTFKGCSSLKEVILPENTKEIGSNAFQNCVALEKVYIPQSTKTLGNQAFMGCEALSDVIIADYSITSIGTDTFKDCPGIVSIVLPKGLKSIGKQAFMNDTGLTSVTIPESVTSIDSTAFSYPKKTTIYGKTGSYAETFANEYGFTFVDISIPAQGIILKDGFEIINLDRGETYRAEFEFYPENANDVVTLTASNTKVKIEGMDIYAQSAGDTVITATTSSGMTYEFTVHIRDAKSITITSNPDKTTYVLGEEFDNTGMIVTVNYSDNTTEDVTDYIVSGFDSSTEGICTVTVQWTSPAGTTYKKTFTVEIIDTRPKVTGIYIGALPNKVEYTLREKLDTTGLVIMANYTDGSTGEVTGYTISGYNALKNGEQAITVTYGEFTTTFNVTVGEIAKTLESISISANPNKTIYYIGDTLDTTGLVLTLTYSDGSTTTTTSGFTTSGFDSSAVGTKTITVTYNGKTTTYTVKVEKPKDVYNLGEETYRFSNFGDTDSPYGHCFGMSSTSAAYHNNILDIADVGGNTESDLYALTLQTNVKKPICHYQAIQGSYAYSSMVAGGSVYENKPADIESDWEEVINYVKNHQYDDKGILQIGFRKNNEGGHAINFLRYEVVDGQERIYAYDNNFPDTETYFYMNSNGQVYQKPYSTFSGAIDCICLRDITKYFKIAGEYDKTRYIYGDANSVSIEGAVAYPMECGDGQGAYTMFEIPDGVERVVITPLVDNASFQYADEEYSFGNINDDTVGIFTLATKDEVSSTNSNLFITEFMFEIKSPSRTEIRNKDGIILHANVEGTAPAGSYVVWTSNNDNFDEDADGNDLTVIAKNKGWTRFTATLYDADGNALLTDSVLIYSKSGFFDKIGGFFRSLFGTTKIYEY